MLSSRFLYSIIGVIMKMKKKKQCCDVGVKYGDIAFGSIYI